MSTNTGTKDTFSNDAIRDTINTFAERTSEFASKAGFQVDRALDGAESVARTVIDHGREASERVGEVGGNLRGAIDKSVKDEPMATLVVAAAIGFALGALWKS